MQRLGDLRPVVAHGVGGGLHGGVRPVGALLAVLAEEQVDAAEEEVLELAVEPIEVDPGAEHLRVPFGERAGRADLAALGGVVHQELGLVDLLFEASVHPVQMLLLDTDLAVPDSVPLRRCLRVRGVLRGHPSPLLLCLGQPSSVREQGW